MLQAIIIHINILESVGNMVNTQMIADKENAVRKAEEIGKATVVVMSTRI